MSLPKRRPDPKLPANQMTKMYTGVAEAATSPDVAQRVVASSNICTHYISAWIWMDGDWISMPESALRLVNGTA